MRTRGGKSGRKRPRDQADAADEAQDDPRPASSRRRRNFNFNINFVPEIRYVMDTVQSVLPEPIWYAFNSAKLEAGTYYATISGLWGVESAEPFTNEVHKSTLHRTAITTGLDVCRHVSVGQRETINPYRLTEAHMHDQNYVAKPLPSRTSHSSAETKSLIWPVNITNTSRLGDIAHILPAAPGDANTWWFTAPWVIGVNDRRQWNSWDARMRAIHGYTSGTSREEHTGIKHMITNKARVPYQRQFWDNNPCLLVIPILTPQQVKEWDGGGYNAIQVIDQWEGQALEDVATGTQHDKRKGARIMATGEEIETARFLLAFFLRSILTAKQTKPRGAPREIDSNLYSGTEITIPSNCLLRNPSVRMIYFTGQAWDDPNLHPAPDPALLTTKAAVIFSTRHNQRLAAGGETEDDDENWTELDEQAAEEYLDWRQEAIRARMDSDLLQRTSTIRHSLPV